MITIQTYHVSVIQYFVYVMSLVDVSILSCFASYAKSFLSATYSSPENVLYF